MVFQDGVIYQAPVVFDNLIAKGDIPPLVGLFIKPGVVPAANENALPRFNRSFEYDSVTPLYSRFLIEEFLPAVEAEHGIRFSTNPNEAAISGNSSGGICAFMVAWHRPDRFRRVFTGVGTYVGIHGADQLPVWVRKFEPKPIRVFLQSGTGDNNLYCGDWWMANQMMERSLSWAGYDVNHAWGEGGHNQKHASQVFPEAMRWLWREWKTAIEVKANAEGASKWKGYEVVGEGSWEARVKNSPKPMETIESVRDGSVMIKGHAVTQNILKLSGDGRMTVIKIEDDVAYSVGVLNDDLIALVVGADPKDGRQILRLRNLRTGEIVASGEEADAPQDELVFRKDGVAFVVMGLAHNGWPIYLGEWRGNEVRSLTIPPEWIESDRSRTSLVLSPDQTVLYVSIADSDMIGAVGLSATGEMITMQTFGRLLRDPWGTHESAGMCVDSNGWLYVATSLGIQVLDQAGRVNFIIPTPKPASDVCFGGKDLSELFIACGDTVYKRATKAKGVVSGQMVPIKPAPPKL